MKRRGKSPPDAVATRYAARLMGCKAMYTGTRVESPPIRGVEDPQWVARSSPGGRLLEHRS